MNKQFLLKLNLQHFADEGTTETNNTEPEFKAPATQSELDSYVNKAVQAALKKQQAKNEANFNSRLEEEIKKREDYSKLSESQKRDKDFEDQKAEFEKQVAEFRHSQLIVEVQKDLVSKGLPTELAETFALHGTAEDALKAVNTLEKVFNEAVNKAVKESARQTTPNIGATRAEKPLNLGARLAQGVSYKKPF